MTDIGRVRFFATNTQAAVEAGSICACHPAHLTSKPIESPGTGTFKGAGGFLNRDKLALGRRLLGAKSLPSPLPLWLFVQPQVPGYRASPGVPPT